MKSVRLTLISLWIGGLTIGCNPEATTPLDGDTDDSQGPDAGDAGEPENDSTEQGTDSSDEVQMRFKEQALSLVSQMTLEEKVSQMGHEAPSIQRLGIPSHNWWNEALHGVARSGYATVFPQAIGLAGTFDPDLIYEMASVISTEARVMHHVISKELTYWSPTVNLARDPRWGRNEETYGEDPFLASRIAVQFVKGMQGDDPTYLKTIATPKHFIANNEEVRRHTGSSNVDERNLREYYMPAFKAAVMEGGAYSVMCAYNAVNGVPSCANSWLLTDVLRNEWGFKGYVVSDCWAVNDIISGHHFVDSNIDATIAALTAGTDLNCGNRFQEDLLTAVQSGRLSEELLDTALVRLFTARFKLGLFEAPEKAPYTDIPDEVLESTAHGDLARTVAEESMVLLKNEGILPLDPSELKSMALIGPMADMVVFGGYSGRSSDPYSPFRGIEERLLETDIGLVYGRGSDLYEANAYKLNEAVDIAVESDVAVVVLGIEQGLVDEEHDRMDLGLPAPQQALLEAVYAANPRTIAVLVTAGPLTITWADEHLPAIINIWYGGQAAGEVLASILFGDVNPSGRLAQTFYLSEDDLPPFDDYDIIGSKRTYMHFDKPVLYPFGHGLSYTKFDYTQMTLSTEQISADDVLTVSVDVENTGHYLGAEVIQVYVTDEEASVPTAIRKLKGFKRVTLKPDEKQTVSVALDVSDFGFYDIKTKSFVVEPGVFTIQVGASSSDIRLSESVTVVPE